MRKPRIKKCGHPETVEDCKLCWLYQNVAKYKGAVAQAPEPLPEPLIESQSYSQPDLTEAYLINLDRRPDRLAECEPEFAKAGYRMRRFAAVDGNQVQPYPAGFKAGGGALGCKLSHVAVLRDALNRGLDQVTVFEDDVVFVTGYQANLAKFMETVPDDWQAIFLGGQHKKPPVRLRAGVGLCVDTHRTHAYIVRGEYIRTLLELFENSDTHIDHTWGFHQVKEMPKIYCPFPTWLCGQRAGKSDINGRQLGERYWTAKNAKTPSRPVAKNRPMCECGRLPKLCCGKPCHSCQMDRIKSIRAAAGR